MALRDLAMQVAGIAQDAGKHALNDQVTPKDLAALSMAARDYSRGLDVDKRLSQFIYNRLTYIDAFQGRWEDRPEHGWAGSRYWCIGGIDGVINYSRNMAEWAVTISLFEFNEFGSAQPIIGVVHAPALALTYVAARREGAIRIRRTPLGEKREKIMPSTTSQLDGSVLGFGMSFKPGESEEALDVVYHLAGKPADIKRIGPASLDLCKVADGTYDAYFEPHLHYWDVPAMSAAAVVIWEAQGQLCTWNGDLVHWRSENDVLASNGQITEELRPYLLDELAHERGNDQQGP
ncbi:MAG: inositol monophosphatase family protein [Bifidobacterium sp.]|nr:inositol monophosphatase family protein [Bifidobacterium sp.]